MFGVLVELVKLSARPATIVYPYPIAVLAAFSLSNNYELIYLLKGLTFSFLFYAGANLWNHVNDVEEDIKGGKRTIITEDPVIRELVIYLSVVLYAISISLASLWTLDFNGFLLFIIAVFTSWVYSDKILWEKRFRRWKNHYVTETITFTIGPLTGFLMLWTIFAPLSIKGLAYSTTMTFFMLSAFFLKDIKDITGDRLSDLKTLGVFLSYSDLLKISFLMLILYYLCIIIFSTLNIFSHFSLFSALFIIGFLYTLRYFINKRWSITLEAVKPLEMMYYSSLGSLVTLILTGFI